MSKENFAFLITKYGIAKLEHFFFFFFGGGGGAKVPYAPSESATNIVEKNASAKYLKVGFHFTHYHIAIYEVFFQYFGRFVVW